MVSLCSKVTIFISNGFALTLSSGSINCKTPGVFSQTIWGYDEVEKKNGGFSNGYLQESSNLLLLANFILDAHCLMGLP